MTYGVTFYRHDGTHDDAPEFETNHEQEAVFKAETYALLGPVREAVVWKDVDGRRLVVAVRPRVGWARHAAGLTLAEHTGDDE